MTTTRRTAGHLIGIAIAVLYTLAGQAHFTDRFTPGLAAQIEEMTPRSHRAYWFLNLSYSQLKQVFGAFDLLAAAALWRPSSRRIGLRMAVVGFSGGLYAQWYTGGHMGQVGVFLALAVLGTLLL